MKINVASLPVLAFIFAALLAGCAPPTPTPTLIPTATLPTPDVTVNLMTDTIVGTCPQSCTLRAALASVRDGGVVGFDKNIAGAIALDATLEINKNIFIVGPGASTLALSGNNALPVLTVHRNTTVNIHGLSIIAGKSAGDGGGLTNYGTLILDNVNFSRNAAGRDGGAIYNAGRLSIRNSNFARNTAGRHGGAIANRGDLVLNDLGMTNNNAVQNGSAIYIEGGAAVLTNATVAENATEKGMGALTLVDGSLRLMHSTVARNVNGGVSAAVGRDFFMRGSIVATNTPFDINAVVKSEGYNLIGKKEDLKELTNTDQWNLDPKLDAPGFNSPGNTATLALLDGSPAIGRGGDDCPQTDQRGVRRKRPCDTGAYEYNPPKR